MHPRREHIPCLKNDALKYCLGRQITSFGTELQRKILSSNQSVHVNMLAHDKFLTLIYETSHLKKKDPKIVSKKDEQEVKMDQMM